MTASPTPKLPISLVIITHNEESNIQRCIASVPFADEIIVVDSGSTDNTRQNAEKMGAKVVHHDWPGFGPQKNFAAALARNSWILSLDADEELSKQAVDEIIKKFSSLREGVGYQFPRISKYMGKWIRHGGWYPDRQLRLYNKKFAQWSPSQIHEKIEVKEVENMSSNIQHYVFANISAHIETNNRYSGLLAKADYEKGKRFSYYRILVKPPVKFMETYFLKLGFLDGLAGFVISASAAYSIFLRVVKTWEIERISRD